MHAAQPMQPMQPGEGGSVAVSDPVAPGGQHATGVTRRPVAPVAPVAHAAANGQQPAWLRDVDWATRERWHREQADRLEHLAYDDEEGADELPF